MARKALEKLARHPQIDMVFSDVVLGGDMDGYGLALEAMKARPEIKILLTSGYNNVDRDADSGLFHAFKLLSKPYKMGDLARSIRGTLDDRNL